MRQLAVVERIREVEPIPNADAIEKVRVRDWWCVAKKGEFRVDELCVYFEIDSLLPMDNEAFAFLGKSRSPSTTLTDDGPRTGYRLRTVRLRGQISQGLALPMTMLGIVDPEGTDVTAKLNVVKWEPPFRGDRSLVRGPFPSFIPKTDEERVQNIGDVVAAHAGRMFYVTEKLDGSSITIYRTGDDFGVCSRNLNLKDGQAWNLARELGLEEKLPPGFALQCEIVGEGIQGNPLKLRGNTLYAYSVYSIKDGRYLDGKDAYDMVLGLGMKFVPVIDWSLPLPGTVDEVLALADRKSLLSPQCEAEGIVLRPLSEGFAEMRGSVARLSFKAISTRYLLAEK